jgi:hypothetical protein
MNSVLEELAMACFKTKRHARRALGAKIVAFNQEMLPDVQSAPKYEMSFSLS